MLARSLARIEALLAGRTYGRYVIASAVSLGVDMALFLLLLHLGVPAMGASALGYAMGIVAHWLLSTRFVFDDGMASSGGQRARQKGLFVGTAIIGLSLTTLIVGGADGMGLDPRLAKVAAIIISFQATYFARRITIFRA
ncbi:GtrA family protein [Sphingobium sufflavum]|uniref:GtrA family protein n=1 Tax=Sphingobium sufflavum TaxID=1129547 RepID=UPI001F201D45|nr:GtrA family protein [Sphingobium sufflavum]MCE7795650.1 GtrA family protein [Sphingobium sufflavum]